MLDLWELDRRVPAASESITEKQLSRWKLLSRFIDLLDKQGAQIAHWKVEMFFRWLKWVVPCRHWFAESREGVLTQIYLCLIKALLLAAEEAQRAKRAAKNSPEVEDGEGAASRVPGLVGYGFEECEDSGTIFLACPLSELRHHGASRP